MVDSAVVTIRCGHGHPDFELKYNRDVVLKDDLLWLSEYLENMVDSGVRYRPDETLQIGWVVTQVRYASDSEKLSIFEPDFAGSPLAFTESVTMSLGHLRLQLGALESLGLEADFPSTRQSAICCNRLSDFGGLFLRREEACGHDSGWFIGCLDSDHNHDRVENLKRSSLYELVCENPSVVEFLAFPVGVSILLRGSYLEILEGEGEMKPKPGSLLDQKFEVRS